MLSLLLGSLVALTSFVVGGLLPNWDHEDLRSIATGCGTAACLLVVLGTFKPAADKKARARRLAKYLGLALVAVFAGRVTYPIGYGIVLVFYLLLGGDLSN